MLIGLAMSPARNGQTLANRVAALFADGTAGAWYDPSDLSTLFQTSAGVTAVTATGQSVGLMLDKSKGLALSANVVANNDFPSGLSGWTVGSDAAQVIPTWVGAGQVSLARGAGGNAGFEQTITGVVSGSWYKLTIKAGAGSGLTVAGINGMTVTGQNSVASGQEAVSYLLTSATTISVRIWPTSTSTTGVVERISLQRIEGNHVYQSTSASRPIFRVENYNALTYTRDFTNAAWNKTNANVTANTYIPTSGTPELLRTTGVPITAGQAFTISGVFKPIGDTESVTLYASQSSNGFALKVNLLTGELISWAPLGVGTLVGYSIAAAPGGGWRLSASGTISGGTSAQWRVFPGNAAGTYVTVNSVNGLQIDEAQLQVNTSVLRPYQWVDAEGTFDNSVGQRFLAFDGVDDLMTLPTRPLSGFNNVVSASVRMSNIESQKAIYSQRRTTTSTPIVGQLDASTGTPAVIRTVNRNDANTLVAVTATAPTPNTIYVQTGIQSTAETLLRSNGAQVAAGAGQSGAVTTDTATIGAVVADFTGAHFVGALYQLVVLNKVPSAAELATIERQCASKVGITL
jgi:hypothetical protein